MALNIHLACGGTGGHIFPGLATAQVLRARGHDVTLWLAGKDVEGVAVAGWSGPAITVPSEGFASGARLRAARTAWRLARAIFACTARMRQAPPDVMLGMGSYASVGPVCAAAHLGVPIVLHEANVIPGRAVSLLSRRACAVGAVFEETRFYLKGRALHITGMPLRPEALAGSGPPRETRPASAPFTVLVIGGSRGAHALNRVVTEAAAQLNGVRERVRFVHLTGTADEAQVRADYADAGVEHTVFAFHAEMGRLYASADLAICRAGAATCAELLAHGLPALLIPLPHATRRHQHENAHVMSRMGAADMVDELDLDSRWLAEYITGMRRAPDRRRRMSDAARARARTDAAEALATLVEQSARRDVRPAAT